MPRTSALRLSEVAAWHNVAWALARAARGKRSVPAVRAALAHPERTVERVASVLAQGRLPESRFSEFVIHDPKRRVIHAAPFLDRVAHHALVRLMEPAFERVLLPSVFACRPGFGTHAAILAAQRMARRHAWVMHVDIEQYFPSIDHETLRGQLRRRFRGDGLRLVDAVIGAFGHVRGLPIGALTSQHFANHYLNDADRWCLARPGINGHIRYMDDFLLFAGDKETLRDLRGDFASYLWTHLGLRTRPESIQRTSRGFRFCGIHVKPRSLRPGRRRMRRYRQAVGRWEARYHAGDIDARTLQRGYASAFAILLPADARHWRRHCLAHGSPIDA